MLFHIEQTHTPENCPVGHGGFRSLHDSTAEGVRVVATYGNFMKHVIYLIIEADDIEAVNSFLRPGMQRCTCTITPVSEHALPLPATE